MNGLIPSILTVVGVMVSLSVVYFLIMKIIKSSVKQYADKAVQEYTLKHIKDTERLFNYFLVIVGIIIIICLGWSYNFKITEDNSHISIKADVSDKFKVPDQKTINKINNGLSYNEQKREEVKDTVDKENRRLVEEALKIK